MKAQIKKWIRIVRPGTLAAGASPVFIGFIVAWRSHRFNIAVALATFVAAIAIQIASNLINDYYDYKKGLDKPGRVGPRRAMAEGEVTPATMKSAILIDISAAVICGCFLIFKGGLPILAIGCASLFCAWLYTATPYSLSYLGIADLFVLLFFGPVATAGTAYLQAGVFSGTAFWLGMVCGLISMGILTVNNIRDIDSDRLAGKRSPVVRFGKRFGELEYLSLFILIIPCLYMARASIICYTVVPAGIVLYLRLIRLKGGEYNIMLVRTGQVNLLFVILYLLETVINN